MKNNLKTLAIAFFMLCFNFENVFAQEGEANISTNSVDQASPVQATEEPADVKEKSNSHVEPSNTADVSENGAVETPADLQSPVPILAPQAEQKTKNAVNPAKKTKSNRLGPKSELSASKPNAQESARLEGDGSAAPVKLNQSRKLNEFGGVPPMPGTRREMAVGEAPEFYSVEEGDTMYDVCDQLIDDRNYWPKLWSLNPDVRNPHFIYPGTKLAFYSGDHENPPFLEVVTEDEVIPVEKSNLQEAELVAEPKVLPGKDGGSTKVFRGLDEEKPVEIIGPDQIGADGDPMDGFIFSKVQNFGESLNFVVPAFYFAEELESLGTVVIGTFGQTVGGTDTKLLIDSPTDLNGGTYSVFHPGVAQSNIKTGSKIGYRYDFAGAVKVSRKSKGGLYEAKVISTHSGIQSGDILVKYISSNRKVSDVAVVGKSADANSTVIGFSEISKNVGGKGDLVFLEKASLAVGGFYSIYKTDDHRAVRHVRDEVAAMDGGQAAIVRVIDITGESALGLIVSGNAEIRIGDSLTLH